MLPPQTMIQGGGHDRPKSLSRVYPAQGATLCKAVIRYAALDKILPLKVKSERQVSPNDLINKKRVQCAAPEPDEDRPSTVCGQAVLLCNAALAAALNIPPVC